MTRKEAKELLPIIQAFAEGKTIQVKVTDNRWYDWKDKTDELNFNSGPQNYRIKPEPKYRPFKSQEECWQEMQKHQPFGWLIHKKSKVYVYPIMYTSITAVFADKSYDNFKNIFENYTFADGTPFGIKEE